MRVCNFLRLKDFPFFSYHSLNFASFVQKPPNFFIEKKKVKYADKDTSEKVADVKVNFFFLSIFVCGKLNFFLHNITHYESLINTGGRNSRYIFDFLM